MSNIDKYLKAKLKLTSKFEPMMAWELWKKKD